MLHIEERALKTYKTSRYQFGYVTWTTPSLMYTKRNQLLLQHGNGQTPCRQFTKGIDENANDTNL